MWSFFLHICTTYTYIHTYIFLFGHYENGIWICIVDSPGYCQWWAAMHNAALSVAHLHLLRHTLYLACTRIDLHTLSPKKSTHNLSFDHCVSPTWTCLNADAYFWGMQLFDNSVIQPSICLRGSQLIYSQIVQGPFPLSSLSVSCYNAAYFFNSFQCHNVFFNILKWLMRLRERGADFLPPLFFIPFLRQATYQTDNHLCTAQSRKNQYYRCWVTSSWI